MTAWTLSSLRAHSPRIALLFIITIRLLGCLSLALLPSVASAQTVSPQIVEFDPSADHNTSVSGVAVVNGYELRFYSVGGTQPLHVIELGKPAPEADGKIRFNFASLLGAWPVSGVVYEARVAATRSGWIDGERHFEPVRIPSHDAAAAVQLCLFVDCGFWRRGRIHRHGERHCGRRLRVDGNERRRVAHDHERRERQRQRIDRLLGGRKLEREPARRPSVCRQCDVHLHSGGRCVRLLVLPHLANRRNLGNDRKRRRHGRKHVLLVGIELGVVADGDERRQRSRERHRELQRRREHGLHRTLRHPDCGVGHLHADAERVVHVHRDSDESRLQSADRNRHA